MSQVLTIISEVVIKRDGSETVSRSFNIIINEYSKHFKRINVIGPGENDFEFIKGINPNVFYTSTTIYNTKLIKRVNYILQISVAKSYFENILKKAGSDIVQIRIPSIFSMMSYPVVKAMKLNLTVYIAGDWRKSFVANYRFLGNSLIAKFLDYSQQKIISNSIAISAGPELAIVYKKLNDIYPYRSTTHKTAYKCEKNNDILELLFVGRLEGLKRIEDGIFALKKLLQQNVYARFHIVGNGVMNRKIIELINNHGLKNNIILHGYISDTTKLESLYRQSDVFIFPSVSEGTPKVLAEAMSYGVIPIAVRTTGSVRYIIKDGQNGFLVDAYSPEQIAAKIILIADSKERQLYMQDRCYEYAKEHTISNEVEKMWKHISAKIETLPI